MKNEKSGTSGKRSGKSAPYKKSNSRDNKSKGRSKFDKNEKSDKQSEKRPYSDRKERTDKPSEKRTYNDKKDYSSKPSDKRSYRDSTENAAKPSGKRPRIVKTETPEKDKAGYIRTRPDKYDRPVKKEYPEKRARFEKEDSVSTNSYKKQDKKKEETNDRFGRKTSSFRNPENKPDFKKKSTSNRQPKNADAIRLNKYIANAGICSRRDADVLIESGNVLINGKIVTELGTKVYPGDTVTYDGRPLVNEKKVYLLLNKPKDYITTNDDPQDRRTVFALIEGACRERIYPVGRLDRMTTGVLLFTNDGDLAKKLTHPKHGVRKVYHVVLDKPLTKADMIQVVEGVELEDGIVDVDKISYTGDGTDKKEIGIELHSGKNRVVRRLFEALGHTVVKLDRVSFAGLTKKDIKRGHWRFLNQKEINILKMLR